MEEVVWCALDKFLEDNPKVCSCEKCRMDMAALALNQLPPRYVVTHRGQVFTKVSQLQCQYEADVLMAIMRAVEKVTDNPRH